MDGERTPVGLAKNLNVTKLVDQDVVYPGHVERAVHCIGEEKDSNLGSRLDGAHAQIAVDTHVELHPNRVP